MSDRTLRYALFFSAGVLAACASTSMVSVHREPGFQGAAVRRVLVIGHFENNAIRKNFEQEFVRQWSRQGVQAVSSLDVLSSSAPINRTTVAAVAKEQKFDKVLVARLLQKQTVPAGQRADPTIDTRPGNELEQVNTTLQVLMAPPVYARQYDLVTVETHLYDFASEKQVWSGTSETRVMEDVPKLISSFVETILKHLYKTK